MPRISKSYTNRNAYQDSRVDRYNNGSSRHQYHMSNSGIGNGNSHESKYYQHNSSSMQKSHYKPTDNRFFFQKRSFKDTENYSDKDSSGHTTDRKRRRIEEPRHSSHSNRSSSSSNYYGNSGHYDSHNSAHMSGGNGSNSGSAHGSNVYRHYNKNREMAMAASSSSGGGGGGSGGHFKAPHTPPSPSHRHAMHNKPMRLRQNDMRSMYRNQRANNEFGRDNRMIRRRIPVHFRSFKATQLLKNRIKRFSTAATYDSRRRDYQAYRAKRTLHSFREKHSKRELSDEDDSNDNAKKSKRKSHESRKDERSHEKRDTDLDDRGDHHDKKKKKTDDELTDKDNDNLESSNDDEQHVNRKNVKDDESDANARQLLTYVCIHCDFKSTSTTDYKNHLTEMNHMTAMRRIAKKQRTQLMKMRLDQRNEQRRIERNPKNVTKHTIFCPLCKLNFRQLKLVHQSSEAHKTMKKFLMPYCRICDIPFRSPMLYEGHLCSILHISKKMKKGNQSQEKHVATSEPNTVNLEALDNLDNFMTIDSIGETDENAIESAKRRREKNEKAEIIVGKNYIKLLKVLHCEVCQRYIPLEDKEENELVRLHCSSRLHMNSYVNFKECINLKEKAERIQHESDSENHLPSEKIENRNEITENRELDEKKVDEEMNQNTNKTSADDSEFIVVNNVEFNVNSNDENLEEKYDDDE